jgi:hypothetical protein
MSYTTDHGPDAYIVRANCGTVVDNDPRPRAPLHVCGSYDAAYGWCIAHGVNGHSELLRPPHPYTGRVGVHIDTPRRWMWPGTR